MKKAIIFDLDGTLIDSLKDIAISTNKVLDELAYPTHKIEEYKNFVGDGAKELVKNALPKGLDQSIVDDALKRFKEIYSKKIHANTKPYDGIYELLDSLEASELKLSVLSNKPHKYTIEYVDVFFKDYDIEVVYGQRDEVPRKPDPTAALQIVQELGVNVDEVYFIGDTPTDILTAKNANIESIGVVWGYRDKTQLVDAGANHIVSSTKELEELLLK